MIRNENTIKILEEFENETKTGKNIEWQMRPWKKLTDYVHHIIRVRVLIYDYTKVDAVVEDKKAKIGTGKVIIYLDGFIELDYFNKWEYRPFFQFLRAIYDNFIHKVYTERFEQRLTYDVNHLYHTLEQFFNMYKHYSIVSKVPSFASTSQ